MSVRVPRDPLTSTRSPGRDERARRPRAADALSANRWTRAAASPAGDRAVDEAVGRRAADDDELVDAGARPRRGRSRACSARAAIAELEHLAEHGDAAAARRASPPSAASIARTAAGLAL